MTILVLLLMFVVLFVFVLFSGEKRRILGAERFSHSDILVSMHPREPERPVVGQTSGETWTPLRRNVKSKKVLT